MIAVKALRALARDERGLSTVEYILILVLVAVVGLLTWRFFGASVGEQVEEARGGVTTLDGQGAPAGGSSSMAGGSASGASASGRSGRALGSDDSLNQGSAGESASASDAPAADADGEDRDPVATQRGSLQAGEGRVTPLRSDGVPSAGDPSAGRGGGGWWKVLATIFLVILAFLAGIPLLARARK